MYFDNAIKWAIANDVFTTKFEWWFLGILILTCASLQQNYKSKTEGNVENKLQNYQVLTTCVDAYMYQKLWDDNRISNWPTGTLYDVSINIPGITIYIYIYISRRRPDIKALSVLPTLYGGNPPIMRTVYGTNTRIACDFWHRDA